MEVARRVLEQQVPADCAFEKPASVLAHFTSLLAGLEIEKFWVLCLNRKNRLLKQVEVSSGTATNSLAHPREVFREAIRHGATAVIACTTIQAALCRTQQRRLAKSRDSCARPRRRSTSSCTITSSSAGCRPIPGAWATTVSGKADCSEPNRQILKKPLGKAGNAPIP
jgi:hypothetical protein